MNKSFFILFLFITSSVYGQSDQEYWDNWNKNYPEVDIVSILKQEKLYADSVEKNPAIPAITQDLIITDLRRFIWVKPELRVRKS